MKQIILILAITFSFLSFSQSISVQEGTFSFSKGNQNGFQVNIPYGKKDLIEKAIRKELKDWKGDYDSKKEEYFTVQASNKILGDKPFDCFVTFHAVEQNQIKLNFFVDLGGAFLNSREHANLYNNFKRFLEDFARKCAEESIDNELEEQEGLLKDLEKAKRKLEKDKEDYEKDIESYEKKIQKAKNDIKDNERKQEYKSEEINQQKNKIEETKKKKKKI